MRVRKALLAVLGAPLLAMACAGPQVADRSVCPGLFIEYDRYAQLRPIRVRNPLSGRETFDPFLQRQTLLLIQNDCQTRSRDLTGLDAVAGALQGETIVEQGAPLGRLVAVHVGALTSEADAARAVAMFRNLGVQSTSIGNPQLGRRVYAGPVATQGALDQILGIAFEAGFVGSYPSEFFRF